MAKDAFDRWWEWVEKPADSPLTIPAYLHDAVMQLPPEDRLNRVKVNEHTEGPKACSGRPDPRGLRAHMDRAVCTKRLACRIFSSPR
jgi:hypothetical protein